jgi:Uma2 family endonuclease
MPLDEGAKQLGNPTGAPVLVSADEYMKLPEAEHDIELLDGVILPKQSGTYLHSQALTELLYRLKHDEELHDGKWTLPLDLFISPYNVYAPDLMFFEKGNGPGMDEAPVMKIPMIVVEIITEETRYRDTIRKRSAYADRGIAEYWIVDPIQRWMVINIRNDDGLYTAVPVIDGIVRIGWYAGAILPIDKMFAHDLTIIDADSD